MVLGVTCSMANQSFVITTSYFQKVMELGLVWLRPCPLPPMWITWNNFLPHCREKFLTEWAEHMWHCSNPQAFPYRSTGCRLRSSASSASCCLSRLQQWWGPELWKKRMKALPDRDSLMNSWLGSSVISQHSDTPWGSARHQDVFFGTRMTSFSFMMGVVRGWTWWQVHWSNISHVYLIKNEFGEWWAFSNNNKKFKPDYPSSFGFSLWYAQCVYTTLFQVLLLNSSAPLVGYSIAGTMEITEKA